MKNANKLVALPLVLSGLVSASLVMIEATVLPQKSSALCAANPLDGRWRNIDRNTPSIVQIDFQSYNCEVRSPDRSMAKIHLFGACHPTNCPWGWAKVYPFKEGWYKANYDQGFADRKVYIRENNGQVTLVIRSTYKDNSGRANNETWDYFRK